jgi:hypothetical protein
VPMRINVYILLSTLPKKNDYFSTQMTYIRA